jgi:plasmid stabilization system protein ParE
MNVAWTRRSIFRLRQILEHIAKDQPANARRFVDRLIERGDSVGEQPLRGRVVPEYQDDFIREVFEGDYRIIYRIRPERVDILTVRHGAQILPADVQAL